MNYTKVDVVKNVVNKPITFKELGVGDFYTYPEGNYAEDIFMKLEQGKVTWIFNSNTKSIFVRGSTSNENPDCTVIPIKNVQIIIGD